MFNYGTSDNHANNMSWLDNDNWDAFTTYAMAFFFELRATSAAATRCVAAKNDAGVSGWQIRLNASQQLVMRHQAASTGANAVSTGTFSVDSTVHCVIANWNGSVVDWYFDNMTTPDSSPAQTQSIGGNAIDLAIGSEPDETDGVACKVGQFAIWKNDTLSGAERTTFLNGLDVPIPSQGSLVFWCKGIADPGIDQVTLASATKNGTVTLTANTVDTYFSPFSGGFALDVAAWLPPLIAAGSLFGHFLSMERLPELWSVIQKVKGTTVIGATKKEVQDLLRAYAAWRTPRVFLGRAFA